MPTILHQVQLCFGMVRHTRLRPVHHAFTYGIYYVRIPLRTLGQSNFGSRFFHVIALIYCRFMIATMAMES